MARLALKARYIFPVDQPPIQDGVITIDGQRIVAVGDCTEGSEPNDLGNVAILPAAVNAHTHLEFSSLSSPLGHAGMPMADWIRRVIAWRLERPEGPQPAIAQGLSESVACGTALTGEVASGSPSNYSDARMRHDLTVFFEAISFSRDRTEHTVAQVRQKIEAVEASPSVQAGISPHAPYTVHSETLLELVRLSSDKGVPLAMHLAESREELELLDRGRGLLRDLLDERDLWDSIAIRRHTRPLDYLSQLAIGPRALVIHGTYLDDEELGFLAAHADRMSLVFCPRTHAFFGHDPYPLAKALSLGVNVALGTDSRASSPDLNLLEEMRFVASHFPHIEPEQVVRMATIGGAKALGRDHQHGTFTAGKLANLIVIGIPDHRPRDPYELVLGADGPVRATWYRGQLLVP